MMKRHIPPTSKTIQDFADQPEWSKLWVIESFAESRPARHSQASPSVETCIVANRKKYLDINAVVRHYYNVGVSLEAIAVSTARGLSLNSV